MEKECLVFITREIPIKIFSWVVVTRHGGHFSTKETTVGLSHPSPGSLWDCQAQGYGGRTMKGSGHVTGPELEGTRGRLDLALPSMTVKVLAMVTAIAPSALAGTCPAPHVLVFCAVPQQPI